MTTILPPAQYQQPSRKGKKAWRKNVDISEVQTGLDSVREDIIQGGTALASRDPADLFTLDTTGDTHARLQYQRDHRLKKPLRSDEILAQRSAVPAVDSRKRPAATTTDGVLRSTKKQRGEGIAYQELARLRKIAYSGAQGPQHDIGKPDLHERAADGTLRDLWADPPAPAPTDDAERFDFIPKPQLPKPPRTLQRAPAALTASGRPVRPVPTPDPGRSYNPLFDDWNSLIEREGAKEVEKEKQRIAAEEREKERLAAVAASAAEAERKEAEEEVYFTESEWEGFDSADEEEDEENDGKAAKAFRIKTKAERNRINRRKEAERKALHERKMKEKAEQLKRVKAFAQEVREKERLRQEKLRRRAELLGVLPEELDEEIGDEDLMRKTPGKSRVPEQPLELVLADELQESLRLLKPEGNILRDRFRSMIVRGKIESRKRISQHKKPKRKATEKWTYKDWKLV